MYGGDTGNYLDPLRACSLSGESQVDVGISEPATNAKFDAIIKQRRRTNNRTSVLNDVEKARLDLLVKRIDGQRVVTQTILNRQKKKVENSLIAIEDHKKEFQKYSDGSVTTESVTRSNKKNKRSLSPGTTPLNVTGIELKEKHRLTHEKGSSRKMKMLKHAQEKLKEKQADTHVTVIRFPEIGKILYQKEIKPKDVEPTQEMQSQHHQSHGMRRASRAWSEPHSVGSCRPYGSKRNHRKCSRKKRSSKSIDK
ncbi:uncharacterized protein [Antedon mediterranea]|uniref:uncharacterized protein n=1 Tax=Antedon mediterranea TaxID=105859 RepID=UPI003AF8A30F